MNGPTSKSCPSSLSAPAAERPDATAVIDLFGGAERVEEAALGARGKLEVEQQERQPEQQVIARQQHGLGVGNLGVILEPDDLRPGRVAPLT